MSINDRYREQPKSVGEVLHDIKDELKEFALTRYQMLQTEITEKLTSWKMAAPMLGVAIVLVLGGFLTLTFLLIAVIAEAVGGEWAWTIGAASVTVVYLLGAGICGWLGYREVKDTGVVPEKTMRVLKQDQQWIQREATSQNNPREEAA